MFPELSTDRFLLQQIIDEDQGFIFKGLSHPQVIPFYGVRYFSFEDTQAQMEFYNSIWNNGSGIWWKIVNKKTSQEVGAIGFNNYQLQHNKAEVGYWLLPEFWGKGITTETLHKVIQYMFKEKKIHRIEALIEEGNNASCKAAEKAGFLLEGKMRDYEMKDGKYINLLMYGLLSTNERNEIDIRK